jgi:hypothetical protein
MPNRDETERKNDRLRKIGELKRFLDGREKFAGERGLEQLRRLLYLFLGEMAEQVAPVLNKLASEQPSSNFTEKKELSTKPRAAGCLALINAQAAAMGLAIRCPKTGKPGFFVGNNSCQPEKGRFQLVLCEDASQRTISATQLPEFGLVPREDRVFPAKTSWRERHKAARNGPSIER